MMIRGILTFVALCLFLGKGMAMQENSLGVLMNRFSELRTQHERCSQVRERLKASKEHKTFNLGRCLWEGYPDGDDTPKDIPPLSSETREQIHKQLEQEEENKAMDPEKMRHAPHALKKDPISIKVKEILQKRLTKLLFDDKKEGAKHEMKSVRDHKDWHNLYKSQIGRNVIHVVSGFCLESEGKVVYEKMENSPCDVSTFCSKKSDNGCENSEKRLWFNYGRTQSTRSIFRKENIEATDTKKSQHFKQCLGNLSSMCGAEGLYAQDSMYYTKKDCTRPVFNRTKETRTKSCVVMKFLEDTREALKHMKAIDEAWQVSDGYNPHEIFDSIRHKKNVKTDDVINVASGELFQAEDLQKLADEQKERLLKCRTPSPPKECEEYLMKEQENFAYLDEYSFRRYAVTDKIKKDLSGSDSEVKENLKKILEKDGLSEKISMRPWPRRGESRS